MIKKFKEVVEILSDLINFSLLVLFITKVPESGTKGKEKKMDEYAEAFFDDYESSDWTFPMSLTSFDGVYTSEIIYPEDVPLYLVGGEILFPPYNTIAHDIREDKKEELNNNNQSNENYDEDEDEKEDEDDGLIMDSIEESLLIDLALPELGTIYIPLEENKREINIIKIAGTYRQMISDLDQHIFSLGFDIYNDNLDYEFNKEIPIAELSTYFKEREKECNDYFNEPIDIAIEHEKKLIMDAFKWAAIENKKCYENRVDKFIKLCEANDKDFDSYLNEPI